MVAHRIHMGATLTFVLTRRWREAAAEFSRAATAVLILYATRSSSSYYSLSPRPPDVHPRRLLSDCLSVSGRGIFARRLAGAYFTDMHITLLWRFGARPRASRPPSCGRSSDPRSARRSSGSTPPARWVVRVYARKRGRESVWVGEYSVGVWKKAYACCVHLRMRLLCV
jgi:hypothetical protein